MATDKQLDTLPEHSHPILNTVINQPPDAFSGPSGTNNPLWQAFKLVAQAAHIPITKAPPLLDTDDFQTNLDTLARNYSFRYRKVELLSEFGKNDHGPLIVFEQNGLPAVLVLNKKGVYTLTRFTHTGSPLQQDFSPQTLKILQPFAYSLYRALPDKQLNGWDLLKFGILDIKRDIILLLLASAMISTLGLLIPIATQVLIDQIIPSADIYLLQQIIIALCINVIAVTLFSATASIASMRLQLKMNTSLQAGLWDRLIRLRVDFFKQFTVGDLADRANNIDDIQQMLTGNVIASFINGLFSVLTLALMAYYDWRLALLGASITLIFALFNVIIVLILLAYQRKMLHEQGRLTGIVLQFLSNITKLRFAGKEPTAFKIWTDHFLHINRLYFKSESIQNLVKVVGSVYPVISTAIIYFMVIKLGKSMSFGDFIGFNTAYGQFTGTIVSLSGVIADSLAIIPLYERAKPILTALPENQPSEITLDRIEGEIHLKNVSFHYQHNLNVANDKQLPWVFNDISLTLAAGQTIALVGPSGCGKSTLFRILLGFEEPQYGSVYFDGHKLETLNKYALRQQIGVVLQNSVLLPGTILENILNGCHQFDEQTAWNVAAAVCIDEEIKAMPMGMQTMIAEDGDNLSKGQQQRLLIAQALAKKPKLLFLDEATSALDNTTQGHITEHLEKLNCTCVIAAHRLSTIAHADWIYVFDHGKIVQQGKYEQLNAEEGLFAEMMLNQKLY